jgi:two-component system LytT family response regulator
MNIRTVIIDDEEPGIRLLRRLLLKFPQISLVGTANSSAEALQVIRAQRPNLVFLDINMPGRSGFDLLKNIDHKSFEVIIASAYDHAITAYRYDAIDYLLKPFNYEDLKISIEKAERKLFANLPESYPALFARTENQFDKLAVPHRNGVMFIKITDIVRCEGIVNYTKIYLKTGEPITSSKTLADFERQLVQRDFFRIHKSHLINLCFIEGFTRGANTYVIMSDNAHLQVSRRNRDILMRRLSLI